jgi:hypothetical protein
MKEFTVRVRNTVNGIDLYRKCYAENVAGAESEVKSEIEARKHAWRILGVAESSAAPVSPQSPATELNPYAARAVESHGASFKWGCLCFIAVATVGAYGVLNLAEWYFIQFLLFFVPFSVVLCVLGTLLVLTGKK